MRPVYLLTAAALDGAGDPVTVRVASDGYHEDAHNWPRRLSRPVLFAAAARMPWLRDVGSGSVGDAQIDNSDGRFDALIDYALDGRDLLIEAWDGAALKTVQRATITRTEADRDSIRLVLRPRGEYLQQDHPQDIYAGDGSPLEGDDDIAGQPKQQVHGSIRNGTPVLVNFGLQIYQISSLDDCTVSAARDRAVPLAYAGDYASEADLIDEALTPPAGTFRRWRGYVRLGSTAQALTVDAHQSNTHATALLEQLVTAAGGVVADPPLRYEPYITADGSAYETADGSTYQVTVNPLSPPCGILLDQPRSTASMIDELAASIGGYWTLNADDEVSLRSLRIEAPVAEIKPHQIRAIERLNGGAGANGLPIWRISVQADRVETVQSDVAAGAPNAARWASEYRTWRASDSAVRTRHPLSPELTVQTALRSEAPALASRLGELLGTRRDTTQITVPLALHGDRQIGDTITVRHPRFGYASGRDMIVLGREPSASDDDITFRLWG